MSPVEVTTKINRFHRLDELLTGDERYPVLGDMITEDQAAHVYQYLLSGMSRFYACDLKAKAAAGLVRKLTGLTPHLAYGMLMVYSAEGNGAYGHYYRPPFEFHSWLDLGGGRVIDFALPGVIEMGTQTSDDQGQILIGRDPCILAGPPPSWARYTLFDSEEV